MFQRWTKKEILRFILCFAAFFVLVLATQLPGFFEPVLLGDLPGVRRLCGSRSTHLCDEYEKGLWIHSGHSAALVHCLSLYG